MAKKDLNSHLLMDLLNEVLAGVQVKHALKSRAIELDDKDKKDVLDYV